MSGINDIDHKPPRSAPELVESTRPHDLRDLRIVTEYAMLQLSIRHGHLRRFRLVLQSLLERGVPQPGLSHSDEAALRRPLPQHQAAKGKELLGLAREYLAGRVTVKIARRPAPPRTG